MKKAVGGVVLAVLLVIACGGGDGSSSGSGGESAASGVCAWDEVLCISTICDGCTAGPYGSCPPKDDAYEQVCQANTREECFGRNRAPSDYETSTDAHRYRKNLRFYAGGSCSNVTAPGETVCAGVCQGS